MIKFLGNWVQGVAVATVIASIFEMILPEGNNKKYIKIVLGIFVMFNIIAPFVNNDFLNNLDFNKLYEKYSSNLEKKQSTNYTKNINEIYIQEFENNIKNKVEDNGYNVKECNVKANFDKENAGIKEINIILNGKNKKNVTESKEDSNNFVNKIEINLRENNDLEKIPETDIKKLKKDLSDYYEIKEDIININ